MNNLGDGGSQIREQRQNRMSGRRARSRAASEFALRVTARGVKVPSLIRAWTAEVPWTPVARKTVAMRDMLADAEWG